MKYLAVLIMFSIGFWACQKNLKIKTDDCMAAPDPDRICTMQYDPVCGCDGKTYGNACSATAAGVKKFSPGTCDEKP